MLCLLHRHPLHIHLSSISSASKVWPVKAPQAKLRKAPKFEKKPPKCAGDWNSDHGFSSRFFCQTVSMCEDPPNIQQFDVALPPERHPPVLPFPVDDVWMSCHHSSSIPKNASRHSQRWNGLQVFYIGPCTSVESKFSCMATTVWSTLPIQSVSQSDVGLFLNSVSFPQCTPTVWRSCAVELRCSPPSDEIAIQSIVKNHQAHISPKKLEFCIFDKKYIAMLRILASYHYTVWRNSRQRKADQYGSTRSAGGRFSATGLPNEPTNVQKTLHRKVLHDKRKVCRPTWIRPVLVHAHEEQFSCGQL